MRKRAAILFLRLLLKQKRKSEFQKRYSGIYMIKEKPHDDDGITKEEYLQLIKRLEKYGK